VKELVLEALVDLEERQHLDLNSWLVVASQIQVVEVHWTSLSAAVHRAWREEESTRRDNSWLVEQRFVQP
jgi:hypothetical protein